MFTIFIKFMRHTLWLAGLAVLGVALRADTVPIIDGLFEDWAAISGIEDPAGDQPAGGIDFLALKFHISEHELLVYVKTMELIDWRASPIHLYVDTDGDAASGLPFGSLGADYAWDFSSGYGSGTFYDGDEAVELGKGTFISAGAPVESSKEYEFAIPLAHFGIGAGKAVTARLFFRANSTGDLLPDDPGSLSIPVPERQSHRRIQANWEKIHPADVRIISWNVYQDGPYADEKDAGAFGRQLKALNPDIIHFQELYNASTTWVRNFLQEWIPAPAGRFWFTAKQHDCITASLFPIVRTWSVENNLFVELNMQSVWGTNAIMLNAHTPAGSREPGRIDETVAFLNWIRQARADGIFSDNMPLLLIGDFNTGTTTPEIISMRTGYYPDGSGRRAELVTGFGELVDLLPVQLDSNYTYTWHPSPERGRGRLDYIYYPFNQLWATQSFVLAPEKLSAANIARIGLLPTDTFAADHKIVGADFRLQESAIPGQPVTHMPDYLHDGYSLIYRLYEPWFYGYGFGWLMSDRSLLDPDTGFFLFWHENHGWSSSTKEIWPWAWRYEAKSWALVDG